MSFTYTPATPTDIDRVRFHTGDTIEATAMHSDEEIQFVISEEGGWKPAVIALLQSLIARLSASPDFQADWLRVDASRSVAGYKMLLAEKRALFGIGALRSTSKAVYRSDSLQADAPDGW